MKTLLLALTILFTTSCGVIPHVTPGITVAKITEAKKKCVNDAGLNLVNATFLGYTAVCNNEEMYLL